ncbi:hypothetical protein HED60_06640 [Planctomycetales bacterium ZRK34]|nr:hypothetical protein HED60_06640 [Planctomycetales bacterium ZRK34]
MIYRSNPQDPDARRRRMIAETSAWLTWALDNDLEGPGNAKLPRIPRRRVDMGGFGNMLNHPGARAAVYHWWMKTLGVVHNVSDKFGL